MPPRRGGSSFADSSSSLFDDDSPWNEDVTFYTYGARDKLLTTVALAFEIITLIACLVFLVASCFIKRPKRDPAVNRVPSRSLFESILSNIIRSILTIIYLFFYVFEATVKQSYVVLLMFQTIFNLLALILIFYVFYRILHNYLNRLYHSRKGFLKFTYLHWGILGIISVLSLVEAILRIVTLVQSVNSYDSLKLDLDLARLSGARMIISWLASLEIILCAVFVVIKSSALEINSRVGSIFLGIGCSFFFILCFSNAIIAMRYTFGTNIAPDYINTAISILYTICIVGLYTGIIGWCILWRRTSAQHQVPSVQQQYAPQQPFQYQQPVGQFQAYQPPNGQQQPYQPPMQFQQQPGMYQMPQAGYAPQPAQWQQQQTVPQQPQYGQVLPSQYQQIREIGSQPGNQPPQIQTGPSPGPAR